MESPKFLPQLMNQPEPLVDGVNIRGDKVIVFIKGAIAYEVDKKVWHEAQMQSRPLSEIPNSLEEWCNG